MLINQNKSIINYFSKCVWKAYRSGEKTYFQSEITKKVVSWPIILLAVPNLYSQTDYKRKICVFFSVGYILQYIVYVFKSCLNVLWKRCYPENNISHIWQTNRWWQNNFFFLFHTFLLLSSEKENAMLLNLSEKIYNNGHI